MAQKLPIEIAGPTVVAGRAGPIKFRWCQALSGMTGVHLMECEGTAPPSMEAALVEMIHLARQSVDEAEQLKASNRQLRAEVERLSLLVGEAGLSTEVPQTVPNPRKVKRS